MRSSLLSGLTTRGTSFLTAGAATILAGLLLGTRALLSVGVALILLPMIARLAAGRSRYRLGCTRSISPPRVPAGQVATVTLRLENASRLPTGLMLAEDSVPYALGTRPRYVLDGIERGGARELSYPLRSDLRGKFEIGPLEIRIADAFGVVELGRSFSSRTTFVVTPRVVQLPRTFSSSSWAGDGDGLTRTTAAAGEDDVIPRSYRDGDELRRVHWRSTARYGELMVRREEQRWRNRALLFLDTRRVVHTGTGLASSFEFAVSAAASIGVHLARQGLDGQLITDTGAFDSGGIFEDVLLDSLAVIKASAQRDLARGLTGLRAGDGGLIVAVTGQLSAGEARQLAATRRDQCQGIAVLLAVSSWADQPGGGRAAGGGPAGNGPGPGPAAAGPVRVSHDETAEAAGVLRNAGWRVISVDSATSLAAAWQLLPRFADRPVPVAGAYLQGPAGEAAG
ncbi:MAG TPA: DUF58 domain-containing protein [Streptosporangiaceae bacterium]|nr:DUF58 domain-containing protein [Streptosporangiaceae bacterium]